MVKNPTPRQVAILSASLTLLAAVIALGFIMLVPLPGGEMVKYITWAFLVLLANYLIFGYYLKRYIYRKIKLIYKTIRQEKLQPGEKGWDVKMDSQVTDEVEKEVAEWAENQRREIDKYKSWAEYRRNYLGDISHELKTPIFNIQGYIESLLDGALEDPAINRSFLQKASRNVDRLQNIVQDLEAISRLESGDSMLEMQVFDVRELTREVFEELEFKAKSRGVALEFKEGASTGFRVRADREKVRQVLINLIHNSIKYGRENGRTKVGMYDMDKHILVEVADNGIGISKEHINHVFDRFYRVDKSRSRHQGGTGLGLAIVKHIVEAHQQTINVRSTPGLGATFGFTLEKA
ncbi:MAG: sensor histidine kinase [Lewinellaceae bacterium]|nr:sensor histidine kinase [Lewinellaceae bacterium]